MTHKTRKFVSVLSQADLFEQEGGGMVVSLPSNAVSGRELKKTLDTMFQPAEYSVRLRRDVYHVTLPNYNMNQLQKLLD